MAEQLDRDLLLVERIRKRFHIKGNISSGKIVPRDTLCEIYLTDTVLGCGIVSELMGNPGGKSMLVEVDCEFLPDKKTMKTGYSLVNENNFTLTFLPSSSSRQSPFNFRVRLFGMSLELYCDLSRARSEEVEEFEFVAGGSRNVLFQAIEPDTKNTNRHLQITANSEQLEGALIDTKLHRSERFVRRITARRPHRDQGRRKQ